MKLSKPNGYVPGKDCGCGADKAKVDYVPDKIRFLWRSIDLKKVCCIHDARYNQWRWDFKSIEHKNMSDREMLNNMLRLIEAKDCWAVEAWYYKRVAWTYYQAVVRFGGPSYWEEP